MGLKFYVGEAQARAAQASQLSSQANQAIAMLQQSIHTFLSAPLSGKAYDSAKSYFMTVYTPLCQSAIMTGEALESAHKRFLSEYQGMVSGIDTDEDRILEEINRLEQLKQALNHQMSMAKTPRPDLERRYMNACDVIAKRREKLEKFHAYNARSASIFSEYEACQQELNRGLAQVKECKAWSSATGTFDIGKLDMTWAKAITTRWDSRAKQLEKERADKFKKTMEGRQYVRVQLASGAYKWMWVKDPLKVSQTDFQFNETYKDYLTILMNPKENGILDDYFTTMAEELRTGINAKTGKPLTNLEKAQRWSTVLSAIAVIATSAYYGTKGLTAPNKEAPILKGNKNGKNYTLDKRKSTGDFSYKKTSGANVKNNVPDSTLKHADLGDFNTNNRLVNGGHGQSNMDYLKENNIDFNIVKEYPNGVRTGNIPSHKNKMKRTGNGQSWFPKEWNDSKICDAGNHINNLPQNKNLPDGQWAFGDYDGVRVGIIKKDGKVTTIIPDNSRQP
jgi:hypothetical protein